ELLSTTDLAQAKTLAAHLDKINTERKTIVAHIMKDVKHKMAAREEKNIIVIGNPDWRVGVLGLVASKIAEEYKKPVFVWGQEGSDTIRGSCRTWGTVNVVELMTGLPENSLLEYGGHVGAGGFAVSHSEVHFLEERLNVVHSNILSNRIEDVEENNSTYMIDASINLDDVNNDNYKVIEKMAPFGMGNPKPIFKFENVQIAALKEFGKEKNHLELVFLDSRKRAVKAIAFFKTRETFKLNEGDRINLLATFEKSFFAGRTELRLRIVDIV
ncbi:MAG: single-stranded-DNA-specific exonuclease, single-stranded-DNA-specific exonuclease, partial [Candidatus Parcubacteria bacterium]